MEYAKIIAKEADSLPLEKQAEVLETAHDAAIAGSCGGVSASVHTSRH